MLQPDDEDCFLVSCVVTITSTDTQQNNPQNSVCVALCQTDRQTPVSRPLLNFQDNLAKPAQERLNSRNFKEARDNGVAVVYQLDLIQISCTSVETDNHTRTSSFIFYRPDALPGAKPCNSVKALKAKHAEPEFAIIQIVINFLCHFWRGSVFIAVCLSACRSVNYQDNLKHRKYFLLIQKYRQLYGPKTS